MKRCCSESAKADRFADMIAALSLLCGAPMQLIENLLQSEHREGWLIPCKVAGLEWPTVRAILNCRSVGQTMSEQTIDLARNDFFKVSQSSAARVLRFWQVRQAVSHDGITAAQLSPGGSQVAKLQVQSSR